MFYVYFFIILEVEFKVKKLEDFDCYVSVVNLYFCIFVLKYMMYGYVEIIILNVVVWNKRIIKECISMVIWRNLLKLW